MDWCRPLIVDDWYATASFHVEIQFHAYIWDISLETNRGSF